MRTKNTEMFAPIKQYIEDYYETKRRIPFLDEIAVHVGMSKPNVYRYLKEMDERGILEYKGSGCVVTDKIAKMQNHQINVALVGKIACGTPILAEENIEEYFSLPESLVGHGTFFLLKAEGRSMIDAGISDGDLVLIRQQTTAESGQIIVALIDYEATLKRFYPEPENKRIRLHPENKRMKDIYVDNCIIQGVAVKVLKDLK